ncbi:MAG: type II toxin-antitoxin system VapC family toxin [Deltaproteobacteria bacterium]|nr:type II toxin-antitoxin system VapC family toxin [Deltaproteobacteria bacterium]
MRYHIDTDYLIVALGRSGKERRRLLAIADSDARLQMSAIAWYEFARGPRTPEQLAVARSLLDEEEGVIPFSEALAARAGDVFRSLGSPRKRAADVGIGVTAAALGAVLLTRNTADFEGIEGLELETS